MNSSLHPDDPKPTVKQLNECENLCSKTDLGSPPCKPGRDSFPKAYCDNFRSHEAKLCVTSTVSKNQDLVDVTGNKNLTCGKDQGLQACDLVSEFL